MQETCRRTLRQTPMEVSSTPAATARWTQRSGFLQIELVGSTTCEGLIHPPLPGQRHHHVSHHDDPAVRVAKGVRRQTVGGQLKAHRRNERIGGLSWVCLTTELLS
jgi:hypothetical protein